jgi:hypothetical protein
LNRVVDLVVEDNLHHGHVYPTVEFATDLSFDAYYFEPVLGMQGRTGFVAASDTANYRVESTTPGYLQEFG